MGDVELYDIFFNDNSRQWVNSAYIERTFKKKRYLIELEKRDILCEPGDEITDCYYIDSGIIISYEKAGKNKRVYDFFERGMLVFLEETAHGASCSLVYEALTSVRMYSIDISLIRKLWQTNHKFSIYCMKQMSRDYFLMRNLIQKECGHNADWRVSNLILELAMREGVNKDGIIYLSQSHKHSYLSNLLHMDRATFYKAFTALEEKKLCSIIDGKISIHDLAALKAYRDSQNRKR